MSHDDQRNEPGDALNPATRSERSRKSAAERNTGPVETLAEQFRRNSVALISLLIAVTALAYNTWRNETSEEQRNIRHAAFRVLEALGTLQQVVDARFYFRDSLAADRLTRAELHLSGYGNAALSRDLMSLMPEPAASAGTRLHTDWLAHFESVDDVGAGGKHTPEAVTAEAELRESLDHARSAVLQVIGTLE
ncbi:hypothetical protein [Elongatibacter sediminis]|uniref:CHASE3 domain-containing protein n=1 Tax=Elongatibacter sediminis TaxID=3119006 RepID=A0AAW9RMW0_9GAMM